MKKSYCFIGERRSSGASDFAVLECSKLWKDILARKIIPEGFYFVAGILTERHGREITLRPNIFVQDYSPHSSNGPFSSSKRGYGAIWVGGSGENIPAEDDIILAEANVYQVVENGCFRLVLKNLEWRDEDEAVKFMAALCAERHLVKTSEMRRMVYCCRKSRGYFLAGRTYEVWAQLIGIVEGTQNLGKKVLIVDYNCGLPCIVDFDERDFTLASSENL